MELDKCVLYMKDGSRYVFDINPHITITQSYTDGSNDWLGMYGIRPTYKVDIESYHMEYFAKRTSKRYKKNRRGYR